LLGAWVLAVPSLLYASSARKVLAFSRRFAQVSRMLARTYVTEIEVENIGTVRLPNRLQMSLKRVRGPNREIARFAAAACMSINQFKNLPAGDNLARPLRQRNDMLC
jgi:hypothetical protein